MGGGGLGGSAGWLPGGQASLPALPPLSRSEAELSHSMAVLITLALGKRIIAATPLALLKIGVRLNVRAEQQADTAAREAGSSVVWRHGDGMGEMDDREHVEGEEMNGDGGTPTRGGETERRGEEKRWRGDGWCDNGE